MEIRGGCGHFVEYGTEDGFSGTALAEGGARICGWEDRAGTDRGFGSHLMSLFFPPVPQGVHVLDFLKRKRDGASGEFS